MSPEATVRLLGLYDVRAIAAPVHMRSFVELAARNLATYTEPRKRQPGAGQYERAWRPPYDVVVWRPTPTGDRMAKSIRPNKRRMKK